MLSLYAACALIVAIVCLRYSLWSRKYSQSIPGRKHRFYNILGDLVDLDLRKDLSAQILDVFGNILKSFPKEQLVCIWFSFFPVVFVAKSDAVREVFKTKKIIDKSFHYEWLKPVLGAGIGTCESGKWKSHRRLLNPCFHPDVLRNHLETFNKMSQKLVKVLQKETQEDLTNIFNPLTLCALETVCEIIFGTSIGLLENDKTQILNSLKRCESMAMARIYSFWLWPDFIFWNIVKDSKKHVNIIQEILKKIIEKKKERYLSGERTIYNGKYKGLMDVLLENHLDTQELSEEDVRDEINTFMLAGHDTVATVAMWAVYLIGHHPEVQANLHEEVDRVFGEDKERAVTEEDLKDLRYMDCVLKECNRLYPAVPYIGRHITEETNICGITVPKGTTCALGIYNLHRDEDIFPDPEKFDPDRFFPENRVNIPEFAYIPFGAGPRNCIGFKFGELEVGVIISSILKNFSVESLNKVSPKPGISLHASEPIRIKIRSRTIHET